MIEKVDCLLGDLQQPESKVTSSRGQWRGGGQRPHSVPCRQRQWQHVVRPGTSEHRHGRGLICIQTKIIITTELIVLPCDNVLVRGWLLHIRWKIIWKFSVHVYCQLWANVVFAQKTCYIYFWYLHKQYWMLILDRCWAWAFFTPVSAEVLLWCNVHDPPWLILPSQQWDCIAAAGGLGWPLQNIMNSWQMLELSTPT